jgi:hypothetical protein
MHLFYIDEGNGYGHYVGYVISNVSLGYCIVELDEMKLV